MSVKRYDNFGYETAGGEYVQYADYARLYSLFANSEQENARLKAEVERLTAEKDQAECDYDNCQKRKVSIDNHRFDLFTENKTLKAEVERLTKAGDEVIHEWSSGHGTDVENFTKALWVWAVAKEGKQS